MIRKFLAFAIDRPVLNHLVMILMFFMAVVAYKTIPKEIFPPSELDEVLIRGSYIGVSADVLDKMATSLGFGIAWATVLNLYFVPLMFAVIYGIEDAKNSKGKS